MLRRRTEHFPIGKITVTTIDGVVTGIAITETVFRDDDPAAENALRQLREYFDGQRCCFDFGTAYVSGTPFGRAVWDFLRTIPYGETVSYREVAEAIGHPNAYRAVGSAVGRNPFLIVNPCHRVVASDGIGGFAYGISMKQELLLLEKKYKERFLCE